MNAILRNNEYYGMQSTFDTLYERSKYNCTKGIGLYEIITSKENILLAYRNIKANTGSKTKGTDGITIDNYKMKNVENFIKDIRTALNDYKPQKVRRVAIPKENGKTRPLGIPTMRDRLIQQMFKQVLEPICEAKFYNHSYGFRPNRATKHAIARCQSLINKGNKHHIVDVDIKGFFDNVNHTKLIKQLYNIGIKDNRVLSIISKMLKSPIEGVGIPSKGTPQGGILSPLLSNVVLNDLDWWISNQWENMDTKHKYTSLHKYRALKATKLKEMFIVRYADDFKIFTDSHESAKKIFHAVKEYLENHLQLNISREKSKITNITKGKSEFLGFNLKAVKKKNKFVANTHVSSKQIKTILDKTKKLIKEIQHKPTVISVNKYNQYILGIKNYYRTATHVNYNFRLIAYRLSRTLYNRLKNHVFEKPINPSVLYKRLHKNNYKTYKIMGVYLYPIADIRTENAMNFSQNICNYTTEGRKNHKRIKQNVEHEINKMMFTQRNDNLEYEDNRISRYSMQLGKCSILGTFLEAEEVHCHHVTPRKLGGKDDFKNLVIVHKLVHTLIHATKKETIVKYKNLLQLDGKQLRKLNMFRQKCNLDIID
ncbi:group II intron reverse transcriptase/maturase [Bacillus thuringiensis]|uniref:Group II intron reverse transcriptase/maturase n=1 Tax=Bacillus thuringiensis TaxID=1428 RepID=A0A9W3YKH0_BACTU|nr:group II intron reverse transcriptase/maturase [Bacillus thuringiensis]AMR06226.1 group II intron reverse transcriptase/maturase [Bacillus thuringiensis]AYF84947.1 group II intron reverse transcriptase/maturase [Bacillus thuringiensis]PNK24495.1 group II intron reverse transcriptase/maturase [Bacillus thuringiensis]